METEIKRQLPRLFKPARPRGAYVCPLCGSGTGENKTGALHIKDNGVHAKCFSCGFYGDIFDWVGEQYGLSLEDAHSKVQELLEDAPPLEQIGESTRIKKNQESYIKQSRAALQESTVARDYLTRRGFTEDTVAAMQFGYDAGERQVVIPYNKSASYYIRRSISGKTYHKPPADEVGSEPVYTMALRPDADVVFIVEAQFCAASIWQVGGSAIALGGVNVKKAAAYLKASPAGRLYLIALDNDEAGRTASRELVSALKQAGIAAFEVDITNDVKDPNEALQSDPAAFERAVQDALEQAAEHRTTIQKEHIAKSAAARVPGFIASVKQGKRKPAIPTGFKTLDRTLDGGLHPGLYFIGAVSSLGKTTMVSQIGDQAARAGYDVLFFSLEMSEDELISKSLSRLTYERCGGDITKAKTARKIMSPQEYKLFRQEDKDLLDAAADAYAEYANHLYIIEGNGNVGTEQIRQTVQEHTFITGRAPLVIVDYIQIIAPHSERATDKTNTDRAVSNLKRISRDFDIPILGISSFNRENYKTQVSMTSFKESGAVEYSSDVLIGLQFDGMNMAGKDVDEAAMLAWKRADTRKIELKILKNRNGQTGDSIKYDYRPMFNHFEETTGKRKQRNQTI